MTTTNLILHELTGFTIDCDKGDVYGLKSKPVGYVNKYGYVEVRRHDGKRHRCYHAHRLIWECANGPIPEGMVIHHVNGNKRDNRLNNLELATQRQNVLHGIEMSKPVELSREDYRAVTNSEGKVPPEDWASKLGLTVNQVRGVRHRHLQEMIRFSNMVSASRVSGHA